MKVCIITTVHPPFDERIFHKQAKTLVQAGYDVTLIAQHKKNEIVDGVKIIALPKPRNRLTRMLGLNWKAFQIALRQRADIYHFHDPELLPIGVLLKLKTKAKVIYDVHEDVPKQILTKYWIPKLLRHPIAKIVNITEKSLTRFIDAVVVATEGIAENFQKFKPVVIHNYPYLKMFSNFSLKEKKENIVVYVGGISRIRGAVEMVRALEHLNHINDLRLELIGKFETPELEKDLQMLPGWKKVRFYGWLPLEKVYKFLKQANIGLACLHPEPRYLVSLPVKLFEYMAAGIPVIASNFPLWKNIIEKNKCGLCVNPLDPKEIARAIEYLLTHPEEARKMGENGRRAVEKQYNWEMEAEKLLSLYEGLLNR